MSDSITISREVGEKLLSEIESGLLEYDYYDNGSDYRCAYCYERAANNKSNHINHRLDCDGIFLRDQLKKALEVSNG